MELVDSCDGRFGRKKSRLAAKTKAGSGKNRDKRRQWFGLPNRHTRAWSGKVETGFPSRQTRNAFARRSCSNKGM